jgi:HlyD family secretion protein
LAGLALVLLFFGIFALWSATAKLSGAVAAPGQFVVEANLKKVQHPTGGVVGELRVREGDPVSAGDLLIRLDETVMRSNLQIIVKQLDQYAARRARLAAERDGAERMQIPPEFMDRIEDQEIATVFQSEQRLFDIRRASREGQREQLRKRIAQSVEEIKGFEAQKGAKERAAVLIEQELDGVRGLYDKKLVQLTKLSTLEREAANLEGQRGALIASIAQAEGRMAETQLQILQIDEDLRADTMKEIREIQVKEVELVERRVAAEDQLKHVDLRAPVTGYVHQLTAHTVGGVIQAGEAAMMVVPSGEALQLEARILPQDIDQIAVGQAARVKIMAGNQRTTPELNGTVSRIAADSTKEQQRNTAPYYLIQVKLPYSEIERLRGLKLRAGMQAEVFVQTGKRTALEHFLRPMKDQIARAFKER